MRHILQTLAMTFFLSMILTACSELTTEPEYCLIPTTNNPDITRNGNAGWKPGATY